MQYPITPVLACITGRASGDHESNQLWTGHLGRNSPRVGGHTRETPGCSGPQEARRRKRRMEEGFAGGRPERREGSVGRTGVRPEQGRDGDAAPRGPAAERSPPSSGAAAG